jgi:hypothetical protein
MVSVVTVFDPMGKVGQRRDTRLSTSSLILREIA